VTRRVDEALADVGAGSDRRFPATRRVRSLNVTRKKDVGDSPEAGPYRLVSRRFHPRFRETRLSRTVRLGSFRVGAEEPFIVAGPCAVESRAQILANALAVKMAGAHALRGGAYKPRTSPYDFQGLGREGLEMLAEARDRTGLPVITEVLDPRLVEEVAEVADCLQVGARSMQNFPLLREVGRSGRPVLLKRHWAATLREWLCAAEYVAAEGNLDIILCERGIRTFTHGEYNRNTLDTNIISAVRRETFLPVIVDPSHATGSADMVSAAAVAGIAAGAHGLIIEVAVHEEAASSALSDGDQAILPAELASIVHQVRTLRGLARGGDGPAALPAPA
jgi:3-deoxy-7-phosphoheptulonate synthase